jgi:hypothetical protein
MECNDELPVRVPVIDTKLLRRSTPSTIAILSAARSLYGLMKVQKYLVASIQTL